MSGNASAGARQVALEALAAGLTPSEAAAKAGVTPRSLRRWRGEPAFAAALAAADAERLAGLARRLLDDAELARSALRAVLEVEQGSVPEQARIRAADLLLNNAARMYDAVIAGRRLDEIEERLAALEPLRRIA